MFDVLEFYPHVVLEKLEIIPENEYALVYSLFLYYLCVLKVSPDVINICQSMPSTHQIVIKTFIEEVQLQSNNNNNNITRKVIETAIEGNIII